MTPATLRALEAHFQKHPILATGPVSPADVDVAGQRIGLLLSADYREFIERFGGGIVGPYPVFGLRQAEAMGRGQGSFVDVTQRYRAQGWPGTDRWCVISEDHAGNPYGLADDGTVWLSDHDFGGVQKRFDGFEAFVLWCLSR